MKIPTLETERLILRAPQRSDFVEYRDFYADADASAFYGGPMSEARAFQKFAADLGGWMLDGYGMLSVIVRQTGKMAGSCGLVHPHGWPYPELTWWIAASARRKGYALEASRAVIKFGYNTLKWDRVLTYMDDENEAARRLAEKLGGIVIERRVFQDDRLRNVYLLPKPA